jgi:hypothetical protein
VNSQETRNIFALSSMFRRGDKSAVFFEVGP